MYKICMMPGDGIGPEILEGAKTIMDKIAEVYGVEFAFDYAHIGGSAIDTFGHPFPKESQNVIDASDAILLGAVGGYKWDSIDPSIRPEKGLLAMRKYIKAYSNIRPVTIYKSLIDRSPLKASIIESGVDMCIVRELTGGIYFGERFTGMKNGVEVAYDKEEYSEPEIRRIAVKAFEIAALRNKVVTSVDKMNVLDSSKLWRRVVEDVALSYPQVQLNHLYVDNAAMQIICNPSQFDVLLTNNIFGDILSDEASVLSGSIGLLPSASMGDHIGLYEPIHGSAPDIAGKNIANPIGMVRSVAMMLKHSFAMVDAAQDLEEAIEATIEAGVLTGDLCRAGEKASTTDQVCQYICQHL